MNSEPTFCGQCHQQGMTKTFPPFQTVKIEPLASRVREGAMKLAAPAKVLSCHLTLLCLLCVCLCSGTEGEFLRPYGAME